MDLQFTDEQELITANIRRFVQQEIIPLEREELDQDAWELPPHHHERLTNIVKEMGFYRMEAPVEFGGAGLTVDLKTRVLMAEEMSQPRAGLYAPCYGVFGRGGAAPQIYAGTPAQ